MSASPSGLSNGQTPTPNGGPPQYVRQAKAADPLRPRKKPVRRPNLPPGAAPPRPNGPVPVAPHVGRYPVNGTASRAPAAQATSANGASSSKANGGWTHIPTGDVSDYPLFTTKRALREGLRYHIARFATKKDVDPANQDEFTRPVLLHRRDPKQPPPGKGTKEEDLQTDVSLDSKEREKLEILKAEKEARKAADLAQIAPTGNNPSVLAAKKNASFRNEKTTEIKKVIANEEQKKESDLRYEEALPWHLEDADNKNTWVGNYEAALSDINVIFVIDGGRFLMVPIEKWYKFTPKGQFKTFTIEEAEARMGKKIKESRWVMKTNEKKEGQSAPPMHKLYTVKAESGTSKNANKSERQDMDDIDFDDDLFQDDDEQATVEPDEDVDFKEAQEKIKRDQLGANVFDQANEAEVDKEFTREEQETLKQKKLGKKTRKALTRRERNLIYESDSDHPYSSASESDTSDEEKQKEIDKRKDEEAKNKAKAESSKLPSGASSKGTNTPSGRPKHTDPLKKTKTNLKRSGSPNLSESSGNESSRKKLKKKHHASTHPSGTSTPIPGSRPMSPAPSGSQARKSSVVKLTIPPSKLSEIQSAPPNLSSIYGGSMSDGEATGGEMSDGGRKKISVKLNIGSRTGSRVASPEPGRAGSIGAGGSRAGSPGSSMQLSPQSPVLHLLGYFTGNGSWYGFREKWIKPDYPERVSVSSPSQVGVAIKLALRSHLSKWVSSESSLSLLEYIQSLMGTEEFWRSVDFLQWILKRYLHQWQKTSEGLTQPRTISSTSYLTVVHKSLVPHLLTFLSQAATALAQEPARTQSPGVGPIQPHEIAAALPASGILIQDLMRKFVGRVGDNPGQTAKKEFIGLVKENSRYSADKLLRPK